MPYNYYICYVTLENFNLSHVPVYMMSEEQLSMYALYMSTLGNRPDLFPSSGYIWPQRPTPPQSVFIRWPRTFSKPRPSFPVCPI